jgi:acetyl-CoA carboxylase biotin carboxyl carrier protein
MAAKNGTDPIDTRLVRRLADILSDTGLTEIEVERGDLRVRVARETTTVQAAPVQMAVPVAPPAPAAAALQATAAPAAEAGAAAGAAAAAAPRGEPVKSPMVGTVYLSPTPDAPPFVEPGAKVAQGQTLLIIEAMKTMNPIPAPRAGTVVDILVDNETPVEFGETLVLID